MKPTNRYNVFFLFFIFVIILIISGCGGYKRQEMQLPANSVPVQLATVHEFIDHAFGVQLSQPFGIEADNIGNVYLVDAGNNRLVKFDSDFKPLDEIGGFGQGDGLLNQPSYICLDNNLNLYITDAGNQRISIYDAQLNYVDKIDLIDDDNPLKFGRPAGLAVNDYNEVLIADVDNARIDVFNTVGNFVRFLGDVDSYSGMLLAPSCLGRNIEGNIFVGDIGNSKILEFDSYGIFITNIGRTTLERPTGVDFDHFGNIWVADSKLAALICFDRRGQFLFSTLDPGAGGPYAFGKPQDVTILPQNRIAVSDADENKIFVFEIIYQ